MDENPESEIQIQERPYEIWLEEGQPNAAIRSIGSVRDASWAFRECQLRMVD